jgi:hypothetical protein
MADAGHEWANPIGAIDTHLGSSGDGGIARILWHGAGGTPPTGAELALVHLIGAGAGGGAGDGASLLCEVTVTDTGTGHTVKRKKVTSGGVIEDTSPVVTYEHCWSTTGDAYPVGWYVYLDPIPDATVAHGLDNYWISPAPQYAAQDAAGLVSAAQQELSGRKEFLDGGATPAAFLAGDPSLSYTDGAAIIAGPAQSQEIALPTALASAPAGTTVTPPTNDDESSLTLWGTDSSRASFLANGNVLWVNPLDGTSGTNTGRMCLLGRYAMWDPTDGKIYTGVSGTSVTGDVVKGGVVTTLQSSANAALNLLLPTQAGNAGKVLQTDATNASWAAVTGLPAGSATGEIVYYNGASWTKLSPPGVDGTYQLTLTKSGAMVMLSWA